jgi:hypothetical protein
VEAIDQVTLVNQGVIPSWRDVLSIHPAADLLPRMSQAELQELGENIKKRGLIVPIAILKAKAGPAMLLDGIGRLDAMEMAGIAIIKNGELGNAGLGAEEDAHPDAATAAESAGAP